MGVGGRGFHGIGLDDPDLWIPAGATFRAAADPTWYEKRDRYPFRAVVRLAPHATTESALSVASARLASIQPSHVSQANGYSVTMSRIEWARMVEFGPSHSVIILASAAALVTLIIACLNVGAR